MIHHGSVLDFQEHRFYPETGEFNPVGEILTGKVMSYDGASNQYIMKVKGCSIVFYVSAKNLRETNREFFDDNS